MEEWGEHMAGCWVLGGERTNKTKQTQSFHFWFKRNIYEESGGTHRPPSGPNLPGLSHAMVCHQSSLHQVCRKFAAGFTFPFPFPFSIVYDLSFVGLYHILGCTI